MLLENHAITGDRQKYSKDMKPIPALHRGCGFSLIFCDNQAAFLPVESIHTLHMQLLHRRLHMQLCEILLCQLLKTASEKIVCLLSIGPQWSEIFVPKADHFDF